jgi:hypothetical protein
MFRLTSLFPETPMFRLAVLILAVLLLPFASPVFADGGPPIEAAEAPALEPLPPGLDPADDVGAFALLLVQAVRTGNWWALFALALSMTVSLSRRFLAKHVPFLATDRGGFLSVVALALFGALASGLLSGTPIGVDLLMDALKVALTAAGGFVGFRKVFLDEAKIAAAGNAAAALPTAGAAGVVGASKPLGS